MSQIPQRPLPKYRLSLQGKTQTSLHVRVNTIARHWSQTST